MILLNGEKALLGLEINSTEMQYQRVPDILLIINQYYNNIVEWRKSLAWEGNHFYRDAISQCQIFLGLSVVTMHQGLSTCQKNKVALCYIQGVFFNWASPEFAKCWSVSN